MESELFEESGDIIGNGALKNHEELPEYVTTDAEENNPEEIEESHTVQEEPGNTESNVEDRVERLSKLPLSRIKQIMKMDPEVLLASQDAVFIITKSTEMFIQVLAQEAYQFTMKSKKKTIQRKDIESAISSVDNLEFLDGAMGF